MIKCEVCGRTINEIVEQDGIVTIQEDMPLVCDRCQQKEQFDKQVEILRKAMDYDKIKKQLDCQKAIWNGLKEWLKKEQSDFNKISKMTAKLDYSLLISYIDNILLKIQELEKE